MDSGEEHAIFTTLPAWGLSYPNDLATVQAGGGLGLSASSGRSVSTPMAGMYQISYQYFELRKSSLDFAIPKELVHDNCCLGSSILIG